MRGGLLGGCLAVLLAGTCFGHPFFHWSAGPLPITIDRVLWAVVIGQYIVWRRLGLADPKPIGRAEIALLAFVAVLAASTLTHDWQARNSQPLARLVFDYLMPLGVYWVARQSRITERGILATFAFLAALGLYLALTGLAETSGNHGLVFPKYIASPELAEFLRPGPRTAPEPRRQRHPPRALPGGDALVVAAARAARADRCTLPCRCCSTWASTAR